MRKLWLSTAAVASLCLALTVNQGCSTHDSPQAAAPTAPEPLPTPTDGKKKCSEVVTFDQVQPILATNCAGCHSGIDTIKVATSWIKEAVRRVSIKDASDPDHMPKGGSLTDAEVAKLDKWQDDGVLAANDCVKDGDTATTPPSTAPKFVSHADTEAAVQADLNKQVIADQTDIRYLDYTDRIDAVAQVDELAHNKAAAAKAVASVSPVPGLFTPEVVAPGILRINIDDLGISAAQWTQIENASLLQLESFTQTGLQLKRQTKSRMPIMLLSEFMDTVLRNASIYYNLTRSPTTLAQLERNLGVDFLGDLAAFKPTLLAFNGSQLSPAANRLIARFDEKIAAGGSFWITEDTGPIVSQQQIALSNPLIAGAGGQANLKFAAGEMIYTLPNGMQGFFLADNLGNRLNQANTDVVHDFTSNPSSPTIKNSISCYRCHYAGIIHAFDKVGPGIQLASAVDQNIAKNLYKGQATVDKQMAADNNVFQGALKAVGVDPSQPDPINQTLDKFLGDLNLEDVAAIFKYSAKDFTDQCFNASAEVRNQASPLLLPGGTLSHDQLVTISKAIQRDCRPFFDPGT